ncbi:acyl-CoA desaturase [Streptomyces spinoverrucosus]|uniref:fatty acid desaturase family protein n=1 Tax=Streptomyces spinoverrucosus TaxID=284043 RepID=UPI0018C4178D|nr:acyl-CoA desaturase [Streptomyces spinoverrucosus]MBG0854184.1 acyl-CoA desaturase [Streptomyces spinoverrucosus]
MTDLSAVGSAPREPGAAEEDFRELTRRVTDAGLMRPRKGQYATAIVVVWLMNAVGWAGLALSDGAWWQVTLAAVWLAIWHEQLAFLLHDAGHRQISRSQRTIRTLGLIHGNLMLGVCFGWWVQHHNRHHNHPNHLELDPDIRRRAAVFAPEQARERTGLARFLATHQRHLFFPLLGLEAVVLRIAGVIALRRRAVRRPWLEGGLMAAHAAMFFGALIWLLPWTGVLLFLAVHQGLLGYLLGLGFAINHKGLPTRTGAEWTWLERQVLTSRTLPTGLVGDFFFGGLNYQIEHHLFPGMPRSALRHAYPVVKAFCAERGIPYTEIGVLQSYRDLARHLGTASEVLRTAS